MNLDADNTGGSYQWWVLGAVSLANFSATLDMSIVVISFPRLTEVFNTSSSVVVWLATVFSIAQLGLLLTVGKIGDTIGRKKVYVYGLVVYTLGMVLCSISPNITMLIAARIVQGAGAAVIITAGTAIIVAVFPQSQQGRAIGLFGIVTSVGLIIGPAIGGVIIDYLDWQGIFYTRIPVGIVSLIMAIMVIKEQKEPGARLKLDYGGAVTLLGAICCLLLYLNLGSTTGYLAASMLGFLTAGVFLIAAFIYIEMKVSQPLLELKLFRDRIFTMASLTNVLQMIAGSQLPIVIPFYLMGGLLLSSSDVGLIMAVIAFPPVILAPLSGVLSDKIGNRIPMIFATVCFSASLFFASRLGIDSSTTQIVLILLLFGAAMGIFQAPNQSAIIGAAPRSKLGTSLGVANTMKLFGGSIGMSISGTFYAYQQSMKLTELAGEGLSFGMVEQMAAVESFRYVIFLAAVVNVIAIFTSFWTGRMRKHRAVV